MKNVHILGMMMLSSLLLLASCKKKVEPVIQTDTGADKNYVATRSVPHVDWASNTLCTARRLGEKCCDL